MAKSDEILTQEPSPAVAPEIQSVKTIAESTTLPATHILYENSSDQVISEKEYPVPVIDYSLLVSSDPNQRSEMIRELAKACQGWGFFKVANHGVPESLMKSMIEVSEDFFNLPEEEKKQYDGKHALSPVRYGTNFITALAAHNAYFWRDFVRSIVHPDFNSPDKPLGFRENLLEYSKSVRQVARELLKGISESLGLEADYIHKALNMDHGLQIATANYYPPCPQPERTMGLVAHTDHGVITLLIDNGINGLQIQHNGNWVNLDSTPNTFYVVTSDHLELLTNGKYKAGYHRAVVNNRVTRISIATGNGPSLDTVVSPAPELAADKPAFRGMKYGDFIEAQQTVKFGDKPILQTLRV